MIHVSFKIVEDSKNILYSITFLKNCVVYEIMWRNIVDPGRPHGACALHAG
jgi:hypothetical protein